MTNETVGISEKLIRLLVVVADHLVVIGVVLVVITVLVMTVGWLLRIADYRYQKRRKYVFLELLSSAITDKSHEANQKLMAMLHSIDSTRSLRDKLLGRSVTFAAEIVSTESEGVRYMIRVPENEVATFEYAFSSYMPDIKIRQVPDYIARDFEREQVVVSEFRQTGSFAYPLLEPGQLEKHDLMAFVTGALANPHADETVAYQLVITPTRHRAATALIAKLKNNPELVYSLGRRQHSLLGKAMNGINTVLFGILEAVGDIVHSGRGRAVSPGRVPVHKPRDVSEGTKELLGSVNGKLSQPMFKVNIRIAVIAPDRLIATQRRNKVRSAFGASRFSNFQSLEIANAMPFKIFSRRRAGLFVLRAPSLSSRNICILSASELADLYHFPNNETTSTDNLVKSLSKTLPAPLSLKGSPKLDVIIGRNNHRGAVTDIGLTAEERELHTYIIGATGNGKSTLIKYAVVQDIRNGKGVAVVDPHGDLSKEVLGHIPADRINDVIYLNPADLKYPVGFNLLELPEGLDDDERLLERNRKVDAIISIFRKVFSTNDSGGHRIEEMLRNTIETAMTIEGATLFTVLKLLRNKAYRKRIVAGLSDPELKDFWREEVGAAGDMQRVSMSKGVTVKIDRFRSSPPAKRILEQSKSTIDFEDIINSGKILICNFSEGAIGADTSALFGTMVLEELKIAAERRAMIDSAERRPFYLYVDEFQNFATSSFVKMLSGSRKYKLFLTIAEQSTFLQEDQRMVEAILANVSTIVCFRTGSPADEKLLVQRFAPYVEQGEISNLPRYNFYARMSGIMPQQPVSGTTLVLDSGDSNVADRVVDASRRSYGRKYQAPVGRTSQSKVEEAEPTSSANDSKDYPDDDPTVV